MAEPSLKALAWAMFDEIVDAAPFKALNPWETVDGRVVYVPDFDTLASLLGVPLKLRAASLSGVPALALDVWTSYELRRAGFDPDLVWPRAASPRVLPYDVAAFVDSLPGKLRTEVRERLERGQSGGTTSASANLLGKNYVKQVDVVMSRWQTGPELLVSTKRMDSSFGKNAANRVEESYGDAKNLALRHPRAALGFLDGLRSTTFGQEPDTAAWLVDLLTKLGREEDAYDAVGLLVIQYENEPAVPQDDPDEPAPMTIEPSVVADESGGDPTSEPDTGNMPAVRLRQDLVRRSCLPLASSTGAMATPWDWSSSSPDPALLQPVRPPALRNVSKHAPVRAWSATRAGFVDLESGLEHDLVRLLDRDPTVVHMVPQPCALVSQRPKKRTSHTPDLLTTDESGAVTIWDVKRVDDARRPEFVTMRDKTRDACAHVGWSYRSSRDYPHHLRRNILLLHSFRWPPPLHQAQCARAGVERGGRVPSGGSAPRRQPTTCRRLASDLGESAPGWNTGRRAPRWRR